MYDPMSSLWIYELRSFPHVAAKIGQLPLSGLQKEHKAVNPRSSSQICCLRTLSTYVVMEVQLRRTDVLDVDVVRRLSESESIACSRPTSSRRLVILPLQLQHHLSCIPRKLNTPDAYQKRLARAASRNYGPRRSHMQHRRR